ncbi:T9SS type A sorting domain-containing protein [Mangrovimonas xylaniphaga]|uniref:T9SS type A sorting domain-containing protein n=1 Tax=Mangrovimonas xylaniphaga TaxID=1645915 RepID=UPI0006B53475|nr:T9SS type A sorting domain-containing protein [Mangrovimonas xylaniphaga]
MKKLTFLFLSLAIQTTATLSQTTFDWETLPSPVGSTSLSETRDGITVTFSDSNSSKEVVSLANISYGGSGNCIFSNNSSSVVFTFDTAVNVISILAMNGNPPETYTFTPTGGTNTPVVVEFTGNASEVSLKWTGITSFTVTANQPTPIIFDNLVVTTEALSIPKLSAEQVTIYPNPTASIIYIKGVTNITSSEIYNNLGQLVLSNTEAEINVEDLTAGVYILKVTTDKGNFTRQFVKE